MILPDFPGVLSLIFPGFPGQVGTLTLSFAVALAFSESKPALTVSFSGCRIFLDIEVH